MWNLRSRIAPLMCSLIFAGCGSGASETKYIPDDAKARQALETALTAWKSGEPLKTIKSDKFSIDTFDERWRNGAKLDEFSIISQEPPQPHPIFKVRMRFKGRDEETQYRVLGIDPILVFRAEDYQKVTGQ